MWLDLPAWLTARRVLARNLGWWWSHRLVWDGKAMTLAKVASGARHAWRSPALKRRDYPSWLAAGATATIVRLRSSREVARWLDRVGRPSKR